MTIARSGGGERALSGNIVDYLLEQYVAPPDAARSYIITPDGAWSYGDLSDRVGKIANGLKSLGVKSGQRVLFSAVDGIDFPALFLAIVKIGAVAVPINNYLKPHDYQYFIADSGAEVVIVDHLLVPTIEQIRATLPGIRHVVVLRSPAPGYPWLDDLISEQPTKCESFPLAPDDTAFWLYSSGSTGKPKAVVHTGNHVFWTTELFGIDTLGLHRDDVILSPPKMYFAFGLGNQVYFPLRTGAQVVVNPEVITPQRIWELWLKHQPTVVFGVPTLFAGMLQLAEEQIGRRRVREACTRLRLCVSGGENLPAPLMQRWRDYAGIDILDGVGTTEMTHIFIVNSPGRPVPGSCGRLIPGFRSEIVDDNDWPVKKGQIGNLRVFGPTAAKEFWNNPEKTAVIMAKGGVLTGDKVREDEEGNLFLVGRTDDMIRAGGIWVSPAEVESVIALHSDVLECAVVGQPDAENVAKLRAFVVPRHGIADRNKLSAALRVHVREHLAHIKCPRSFDIVDELPKTSTGKIQRFRLRTTLSARPDENEFTIP